MNNFDYWMEKVKFGGLKLARSISAGNQKRINYWARAIERYAKLAKEKFYSK